MLLNLVIQALTDHWDSVLDQLTTESGLRLRVLAEQFSAPEAAPDARLDAALELTGLVASELPPGHPVRLVVSRGAGSRATPAAASAPSHRELAGNLRRVLGFSEPAPEPDGIETRGQDGTVVRYPDGNSARNPGGESARNLLQDSDRDSEHGRDLGLASDWDPDPSAGRDRTRCAGRVSDRNRDLGADSDWDDDLSVSRGRDRDLGPDSDWNHDLSMGRDRDRDPGRESGWDHDLGVGGNQDRDQDADSGWNGGPGPGLSRGRGRDPGSDPADSRPPGPAADIEREAVARLLRVPALSEAGLRGRGADPRQAHLIRLSGQGGPRYPAFQFDASGRPLPLVLAVNELLDADADPWGAADWWLGRNTWLGGRVPASLIGQDADAVLATAWATAQDD